MQASTACVLGLVTCDLNQNNMAASAGQICCFEQLVLNDWNTIKLEFSWKKVIRKGLKRARSLLSGIRSLQGNTIFRWLELTSTEDPEKNNSTDKIVCISDQSSAWRPQRSFKFDWEKKMGKVRWNNWQQFPWRKKVVSRTATLPVNIACILKQKTNAIFVVSVTVRLRVQIRVRLDSPLMNWTSSREYLEVSNIFVWYKANGSVCWLSWGWELNLFMNVFITSAIRSWLLLLCYWLHPVINLRMRCYYIYWKVKKSIGE